MEESAQRMTIYVGTQTGGCTFELEPRSRQLVKKRRADDSPLPSSVFIGCDTQQDFVEILGKEELRATIAELLTGMQIHLLRQLGQVEFIDPRRNFAAFDPGAA